MVIKLHTHCTMMKETYIMREITAIIIPFTTMSSIFFPAATNYKLRTRVMTDLSFGPIQIRERDISE